MSPTPTIRLIGIDLDGTLLDGSGRLPEPNRRAVQDAVDSGIHVAIVTGRSYPAARPAVEGLPSSVSLIVSSGAVERSMAGEVVARRLLDCDLAAAVLAAMTHHRGDTALIFDRDHDRQIVHESMDWSLPSRATYWSRHQQLIAQARPLEAALVEDPIQVLFSGPVGRMRLVFDELRGLSLDVAVALTEYERRDFSLVDVTAPRATKGYALAWRARQLGVDASQVMAIGDNFNDVDMLEYAGTPVVMGNAAPELRARGWHTTGDQDQCGVAAAIRALALRR